MKIKLLLLSCLLCSACNLAPRYSRPDVAMPEGWRTASEEGSTLANLRWWEALGDPVLNSLIELALENNKDLQVAAWRVNEFYAQYKIVRSQLFPQVEADAAASRNRISPNANFIPLGASPVMSDYTLDMSLSYEIDFWGQLRNETFAAYSEYLAQIENRRTVVLTLVGAVAQAYIILRQLDLEMRISTETLESRRESLLIATYRFEGGLTSEIEVTQAASVYEEALAAVKVLERQIPQQENLLSVLLGHNPSDILRGKAVYEWSLPSQVPAGLPSDLLTRRPDILQAENNLIAANANIGVARAAFFPQISLTGLFGLESFELKTLFKKPSRMWTIGGNLLQLIFTGGRLTGQLDLAEAQQKEALFEYEQTILTALQEVDNALVGFEKAKEIVVVNEADVKALRQYLHLAWLRYYEGQTQYLTILDAERQLFTAEITLAESMGSQFTNLVDIYKALGGGWVIDADSQVTPHEN